MDANLDGKSVGEDVDRGMECQDVCAQEVEVQSTSYTGAKCPGRVTAVAKDSYEDEPKSLRKTNGTSRSRSPNKTSKALSKEVQMDDEPDETLAERLWGLTEMFPESVRNCTYNVVCGAKTSVRGLYGFSRSAMWIVFSSSIILFAPVIVEVERVSMEEAQRNQQKQMLLGPIGPPGASDGPMPMITNIR